jgi:hypothetical protein
MSFTQNTLGQWAHVTEFPVNIQLLNAAKSLLRGIYTTGDGADYLPTTYTNCNSMMTQYITHASHQTGVNWPDQFSWASEHVAPTGKEDSSFAGTVVAGPATAGVGCWTDCSGFITALFAWVNLQAGVATVFPYWAIGQAIPEAGCFARHGAVGIGDETWPNALNYYRLTHQAASMTPADQFQSMALDEVVPGDLVVFAKGESGMGNTGHIMLIAAIMPVDFGGSYIVGGQPVVIDAPVGSTSASAPRLLSVIDQTQARHGLDCRGEKCVTEECKNTGPLIGGEGVGVGMGLILLYMDGGQIQFRWSPCGTLETGSGGAVVLARALAVSA